MPPAITVSPRRVTPSRIYCTTPTSRSPKPSPSRARVWPLGKNCSLNVCLNEYSYLTDFQCFGLGRKLRYKEKKLHHPMTRKDCPRLGIERCRGKPCINYGVLNVGMSQPVFHKRQVSTGVK